MIKKTSQPSSLCINKTYDLEGSFQFSRTINCCWLTFSDLINVITTQLNRPNKIRICTSLTLDCISFITMMFLYKYGYANIICPRYICPKLEKLSKLSTSNGFIPVTWKKTTEKRGYLRRISLLSTTFNPNRTELTWQLQGALTSSYSAGASYSTW